MARVSRDFQFSPFFSNPENAEHQMEAQKEPQSLFQTSIWPLTKQKMIFTPRIQ